ncbi:MAG TPA: hypothetical protein VFE50_03830 [Cyclobacteriaceae bacterium]|nr:hypothetical protein [Cyclobacteriaceae bacterium]
MFVLRIAAFVLVIIVFVRCDTRPQPEPLNIPNNPQPRKGAVTNVFDNAADINILFVGNSLTYENDLPSIVEEIGKMDGVRIGVTSLTVGGFSLDDHWEKGTIQATLAKDHYDLLIAQQGPSALPESQELLRESSIRIANECRAHDTVFGLYMVWPALERDFDRDNSIASYTNAADAAGALLCPAGLAWKLAWRSDRSIPFYGPDNFHPSYHGSFMAAMVIYAAIKNKKDLDFIKKPESISEAHFSIMKNAAINAL